MHKTIFIIALLTTKLATAQENLVLNASFEEYTDLPKTSIADGISFAKNWFVPDESSPDYFHVNAPFYFLQVPNTELGFHPAHTGDAYIGLYPLNYDGYMEHYTGTLKKELKKGKVYHVSFFIRYGGASCRFATKSIGVYFSKTKNPFKTWSPPYYYEILEPKITASVQSNKDSILLNDTAWVEITGNYKANGGEKYITLGKFYDDEITGRLLKKYTEVQFNEREKEKYYKKHTDIFPINPHYKKNPLFPVEAAYYFIDDVSVTSESDVELDFTYPINK
ncbi:MAG TPA: hypothetical protein PK252_13950 [Bacteroidales bacterium]|nr:hypothetical protein [Bacteroidales bacterium]